MELVGCPIVLGLLQVTGSSAPTENLIASKPLTVPLLSSLDCTAFRLTDRPGAMYCYFIACREIFETLMFPLVAITIKEAGLLFQSCILGFFVAHCTKCQLQQFQRIKGAG